MCQDYSLSRRQVLQDASVLAGAAALPSRAPAALAVKGLRPRRLDANGSNAYSMAMHVHSSFDEYGGSVAAQVDQASTNALDVLWLTSHDWRMDGYYYRTEDHFPVGVDSQKTGKWSWQPQQDGPVTASSAAVFVASPVSPHDTDPSAGSLSVRVQSTRSGVPASVGMYCDSRPSVLNYRDNLTSQRISVDVMLQPGSGNGYLEILLVSSNYPAAGDNSAGVYTLSYQITCRLRLFRLPEVHQGQQRQHVLDPSAGHRRRPGTVLPGSDGAAGLGGVIPAAPLQLVRS
jgi:hypothetical protein